MVFAMGSPVRPTKFCIDECLDGKFPAINTPLSEMKHPLVQLAQTIPPDNGKRLRKLNDRIWWRARLSAERAIATELSPAELDERDLPPEFSWWMGYCGLRRDVYPALEKRAEREAKYTPKSACTDFLLPVQWDTDRIVAEQELQAQQRFRHWLLQGIAKSLGDGHPYECVTEQFCITVLVRADSGGEAYLAVGIIGFHVDVDQLALILGMVPGLSQEDWQPEPSRIAEITPLPGQLVFSTLLSPTVQRAILEEAEAGE